MRLKDKVAVITGAAQGIGLGIAERFSAEGARVMMLDINEQIGRTAADGVPGATFFHIDVASKQEINKTVEQIIAQNGRIDICVNNAGILRTGDVLEISEEDFDIVLSVNLKGAFLMSQAVGRHMAKAGSGSIINMSSVASSIKGAPNRYVYGTTKAAVIGLTKSVATDVITQGVRCNCICPGTVESPSLHDRLRATGDYEAAMKAFIARQPMGRIGAAEEIAALAVYLASDDSAFTTGHAHVIDGGWSN